MSSQNQSVKERKIQIYKKILKQKKEKRKGGVRSRFPTLQLCPLSFSISSHSEVPPLLKPLHRSLYDFVNLEGERLKE